MVRKMLRAALIAGVAITVSTPAGATHSWNNYHWARTSNPVTLKLNQALTGVWPHFVNAAVVDWDKSLVLTLINPGTAPSGTSARRCSPITGQILVCNYSYGFRGWLGIASINLDSASHITSGTTKLNDSYFNTASYNKDEWRAMVACQEIGHDFGLDHQNTTYDTPNVGSCMDYTNDPSALGAYGPLSNEHPNQHDYDELAIIYSHLDSSTTATSFAATNFGLRQPGHAVPQDLPSPGDTVAEWGTAIHRDGKGRRDLFVRPLPNGGKMLTHVLWAIEAEGTEAN